MTQWLAGNVVDSHTTLYGVIGDPIRHSKSPIMMNRAFRETGINGIYTAFHIEPSRLPDFITGVRAMGIGGVNVTIPHKLHVMELLDEIDPSAEVIGAVNTIVNRDGRLIGYNTDSIGYVRSLKEEAVPNINDKRITVIGAGGAARGIVHALAQERPSNIAIANRTVQRAEELASSLHGKNMDISIEAVSTDDLQEACASADIIINTTSIGMFPNTDQVPIQAEWLQPGTVVSDLIYNPLQTKLLAQAKERGCIIHGGLGMFIYQGAYAFEYWTGQAAPVAAMRETVLAELTR